MSGTRMRAQFHVHVSFRVRTNMKTTRNETHDEQRLPKRAAPCIRREQATTTVPSQCEPAYLHRSPIGAAICRINVVARSTGSHQRASTSPQELLKIIISVWRL